MDFSPVHCDHLYLNGSAGEYPTPEYVQRCLRCGMSWVLVNHLLNMGVPVHFEQVAPYFYEV